MAAGYKPGDKAYIVESNRIIRECTVVRGSGNMYIIKFNNGGGIQVKAHRLFASKEAAEESILKRQKECQPKQSGFRSPHIYWH